MIAWFGPAVLLMLLAASQLPAAGCIGGGAVAAVHGEESGRATAPADAGDAPAAGCVLAPTGPALPLELPRCRSVTAHGLPAPRAP